MVRSSPARPIHVLHLVVAGDIGGAERLLVDLARRPGGTRSRHTVALFTPNRALATWLVDAGLRVRDRGPVRENPLAYLWRTFGPADLAWLLRVIAEEKPDLLHLHTFQSHVLGVRAAQAARIPCIRTEHHVDYYEDPSRSPFTRWAAKRTNVIVAISDYVARVVTTTDPSLRARMVTVRNGVDVAYFAPDDNARPFADARARHFVVSCRLEPWKQVHLAIEALAHVPNARLTVVGDGSQRRSLEAQSQDPRVAGRVTFVGYHRDPRPFLHAADVAIACSKDEPLGLSVLETLAVGRPVIGFAGGGLPEIIIDGQTGWLVAERSAAGLAVSMNEAAALDADTLRAYGATARKSAVEAFSMEKMAEGYAAAYESALPQLRAGA
jgi:glycosyltransferase involved in cell wall biosynthesis